MVRVGVFQVDRVWCCAFVVCCCCRCFVLRTHQTFAARVDGAAGRGVVGRFSNLPRWEPSNSSAVAAQPVSVNVAFETLGVLFPWSGSVGAFLTVEYNRKNETNQGADDASAQDASDIEGDFMLRGDIVVDVATVVDRVGIVNDTVRIPLVMLGCRGVASILRCCHATTAPVGRCSSWLRLLCVL